MSTALGIYRKYSQWRFPMVSLLCSTNRICCQFCVAVFHKNYLRCYCYGKFQSVLVWGETFNKLSFKLISRSHNELPNDKVKNWVKNAMHAKEPLTVCSMWRRLVCPGGTLPRHSRHSYNAYTLSQILPSHAILGTVTMLIHSHKYYPTTSF